MTIPYIQVDTDFVLTQAPLVAAVLRVEKHKAIGLGVELFNFIVAKTSTKTKPPDGILTDPDAALILEAGMGWTGEPGKATAAFVRAGVVVEVEGGLRVRGTDRYRPTWEKNNRRKTGPVPDRNRTGTGTEPPLNRPLDGDEEEEEETKEEEGGTDERAASPPPRSLQLVWNEHRGKDLPEWREMNPDRETKASARLRERNLEQWAEVVKRIAKSPFCTGQNDRGWKANPDFLLKRSTATKVLEGQFDASAARQHKNGKDPDAKYYPLISKGVDPYA